MVRDVDRCWWGFSSLILYTSKNLTINEGYFCNIRKNKEKENDFRIGDETSVIVISLVPWIVYSPHPPIQIQNSLGYKGPIQFLKESRLSHVLSFQPRISFSSFPYFHMVNFFLSCCFCLDVTSSRKAAPHSAPHHLPPFLHPSACKAGLNQEPGWACCQLAQLNTQWKGKQQVQGTIATEPKLGSAHPHTVKPIYWHQVVVKESIGFIAGRQARSSGQLMLKTPKLPNGFQESIFKGKERRGLAGQVISSCTILWLVDGEVTWWCHKS